VKLVEHSSSCNRVPNFWRGHFAENRIEISDMYNDRRNLWRVRSNVSCTNYCINICIRREVEKKVYSLNFGLV